MSPQCSDSSSTNPHTNYFIHMDNKSSTYTLSYLVEYDRPSGRLLLGDRFLSNQQPSHGQIPEQRHRQQRTAARPDPVHDNVLPIRVTRAAPLQCRCQHRIEVAARIVER